MRPSSWWATTSRPTISSTIRSSPTRAHRTRVPRTGRTPEMSARLTVLAIGCAWLAVAVGTPRPLAAEPTPSTAGSAAPVPPTARSASDEVIARETQRAAQAPGNPQVWVALGDAFMQKARETADPTYYRRAEDRK